ncbi:RNA 2',3'-cyclic phosphodiesterase [Stutzerimonas nosocomialis]|uniref:RNA 2',3'-cyclic phosphodiesterase n=1 Tax=Stutzerimonas nosocomialis TaxID=1056496 RepID=A0A5R9QGL9_9GAMM|nr:RNA 2',3'-cyclic phosphodiesterase [Stutzerimonas nosocomialis]TLX64359.1 RNA 2',3'-cyclic phosphodiesterase [Stutzerimonas nosocomialis]
MSDPTLRLFFALPCPDPLRSVLSAWRDGLGLDGRPVAPANLHLTLAFLGSLPSTRLPQLRRIGAALQCHHRFELHLQRLEQWKHGLTVLMPDAPPQALLELQRDLGQRLVAQGLAQDNPDFRPHVTLFRQAAPIARHPQVSLRWPAERVVLCLSENLPGGVRYREMDSWPLPPETR